MSAVAATATHAAPPRLGPAGSNAVLGTLVFLATEAMLFAGLVSAFLVLRGGAGAWPPPGQPRLPLGLTAANTLVLVASGATIVRALRGVRGGRRDAAATWLRATVGLGTAFLAVQGVEWLRLLAQAPAVGRGLAGGLYSTLIGAHGVHVVGGVVALLAASLRLHRVRRVAEAEPAVTAAALYWLFVVAVWPLLWGLLYLW